MNIYVFIFGIFQGLISRESVIWFNLPNEDINYYKLVYLRRINKITYTIAIDSKHLALPIDHRIQLSQLVYNSNDIIGQDQT